MHALHDSRTRPDLLSTRQARSWPRDPQFEQLFHQHYSRVVQVLWRIVGEQAQAEELADDVFWKLYSQPGLWTEEALGGWLYRTATHLGIDALRARIRRGRRETAVVAQETSGGLTPLEQALQEERARQVRVVVAQLKPAQAQLLILRNSGLSYKELAEVLDAKPSSIGTLLARAEAEFERIYRRTAGTTEAR